MECVNCGDRIYRNEHYKGKEGGILHQGHYEWVHEKRVRHSMDVNSIRCDQKGYNIGEHLGDLNEIALPVLTTPEQIAKAVKELEEEFGTIHKSGGIA